jgi:hypothetical protein
MRTSHINKLTEISYALFLCSTILIFDFSDFRISTSDAIAGYCEVQILYYSRMIHKYHIHGHD